MKTAIHRKVELAQAGELPSAILRLTSGWVVMADTQPVEGYCLLFSDPVVANLNALDEVGRTRYCLDMIRIGDAILKITGAARINYETWGNLDPALHTHIVPRYLTEDESRRTLPVCKGYDAARARPFEAARDHDFMQKMRKELSRFA